MGGNVDEPSAGLAGLRAEAEGLLGLRLTPWQLEAFEVYAVELRAWNERFNLTAITDPAEIWRRHFLDSLTCLQAMNPRPGDRAADVGAGAGFPGLPLKIAVPELRLALIEATGKKAEFCRHIVDRLGLEGVEVLWGRVEEVARHPAHREAFDWALARAVAALPVLAEYVLPLLKVGGAAVLQRGASAEAEARASETATETLGGRLREVLPVRLSGEAEDRFLVVIEKVAPTPPEYPRRVGVPTKRPLGA